MKDRTVRMLFWSIVIANIALIAGGVAYGQLVVQPTWNRQVGDPFTQAQQASTFQLAIQKLNITIQGMHNLGLLPSDYNTVFAYQQTPENSMAWQYSQLNALIARAQGYISLNTQGNVTQLSDVYQSRIYSFRGEMGATINTDEGIITSSTPTQNLIQIAYQDYVIRNAPIVYWQLLIAAPIVIFDIIVLYKLLFGIKTEEDIAEEQERRRAYSSHY